ncbi:MAG: AAC(3) family N-acetyltransferase [Deinococcus sp.]|nr:AAC(3) family N-acetyltransferase [Deinococcus sp.]
MLFFRAVGYREVVAGLARLGLSRRSGVVVHASLSAFGQVQGGARTVVQALLDTVGTLIMPAFTYETITWTEGRRASGTAGFHSGLPVSREIGRIPEVFRREFAPLRTSHPVLSFVVAGTGASELAAVQSLERPYGPIEKLAEHGGEVLLLGVDHRSNSTIHLGEQLAGRMILVRSARLASGQVVSFPFPNCSAAFGRLAWELRGARRVKVGRAQVQAVAMSQVLAATQHLLALHPTALLCRSPSCRCQTVRRWVQRRPLAAGLAAGAPSEKGA